MPDLIRKRSVRNGKSNLQWSQDNLDYLRKSKPSRKNQSKTKPSPHETEQSDSDSDAPAPLPNMKDVERGALFFRSYENQMAVVPNILSNPRRRERAMHVARAYVKRVESSISRQVEAQAARNAKAKAQAAKNCRRGALQFGSFGEDYNDCLTWTQRWLM